MLSKCHVSASLPYPQTQSAPLYFYSFPHIPLFIGPTTRFIERLVHHNNMLDDIGFFFFCYFCCFFFFFLFFVVHGAHPFSLGSTYCSLRVYKVSIHVYRSSRLSRCV